MTNELSVEEAIIRLKTDIYQYADFSTNPNENEFWIAFDMAIKALEQQPCEDCISREDAIRIAEQGQVQGYEWQFKKLCNLPHVTPQPKTGHWVDIMVGDMPSQVCDRCNTFYPLAYTGGGHKYCPNCGAKMEVEE